MNRRSILFLTALLLFAGILTGPSDAMPLQELTSVSARQPAPPAPKAVDNLILLKSEVIDVRKVTAEANTARTSEGLARMGVSPTEMAYYLVHTALPADAALLAAIAGRGGRVVSFVPRNTYIVSASSAAARGIQGVPGVDLVTLYHPVHRLSPRLVKGLKEGPENVTVSVLLFEGESRQEIGTTLDALGGKVADGADTAYGPMLRVQMPKSAVPLLANIAGVQWVEECEPERLHNDAASGFGSVAGTPASGIMNVEPVWAQGLDGSGMVVGHADSGLDNGANNSTIHDDFETAAGGSTRVAAAFAWGRPATLGSRSTYSTAPAVTRRWDAHRFTAYPSGTLARVTVRFDVASGATGSVQCSIRSHTGSVPGGQLTQATNPADLSRLAGNGIVPYVFEFPAGTTLSDFVTYWICLERTSGSGNWGPAVTTGGSSGSRMGSDDGSSWSSPGGSAADTDWLWFQAWSTGGGSWQDSSGHGTHTAGSILGNGRASATGGQFRGAAYAANLVHQSLTDQYGNLLIPANLDLLFQQAYDLGSRIHYDGWGASAAGDYDWRAAAVDSYVWQHPDFLPIVSAGNAGVDFSPIDGTVDLGSLDSPGTAKNCLTVGAAESLRTGEGRDDTWGGWMTWSTVEAARYPVGPVRPDHISNLYLGMAAFSSRGPCADGRTKPDVVAPGTNIVSPRSSQGTPGWGYHSDMDYCYRGGTSMAGALTAGAATLAREFFVERKGHNPSAALLKATLIHGASDIAPGQYGARGAYRLTFWHRYDFAAGGWGTVWVKSSEFGPRTTVLSLGSNTDLTWRQVTITLDQYVGNEVTIGFNIGNGSGTGGQGWWIDDIELANASPAIADNVEGGVGLWSATAIYGAPWARTTSAAHSGSYSWYTGAIAPNQDATLQRSWTDRVTLNNPGVPTLMEVASAPDNSQGWGLVNLNGSLFPAASTHYLDATATNGQQLTNAQTTRSATVQVSGTANPLRATLVWSDPPANPAGAGQLINDLDLRIYRRNAANTADEEAYLPKLPGYTTGDDSTNNVEQVEVETGDLVTGRVYRIEASVSTSLNASYPSQPFALVVSGDLTQPTRVALGSLRASRAPGGAVVSWEPAAGLDAAGFHVLRAQDPRGPYWRVDDRLIPWRDGQASYRFEDLSALNGTAYYCIETVTPAGSRERSDPVRCRAPQPKAAGR